MITENAGSLMTIACHPPPVAARREHRGGASHTGALIVAAVAVSSSLVAPLGVLGLIAFACALTLAGLGVGAGPLRAALAAHAVRCARYDRRDARERLLVPGSIGYNALIELTRLVDHIEAHAPELAQRSDLEALLDRFVALTVARERALRAAEMSDRVLIEHDRDACRADTPAGARRLELCQRRLQCLDECEARASRFGDELAAVADTIRLTAQRAACPDELPEDDSIDRQLTELDDSTEAHRQLAIALDERSTAHGSTKEAS